MKPGQCYELMAGGGFTLDLLKGLALAIVKSQVKRSRRTPVWRSDDHRAPPRLLFCPQIPPLAAQPVAARRVDRQEAAIFGDERAVVRRIIITPSGPFSIGPSPNISGNLPPASIAVPQ